MPILAVLLMICAQVDLKLDPASQFGNVGDTVTVNLLADATTPQSVAAIDAILAWDPAKLQFIGPVAGSYPWFVAGFLNDPDGINTSLVDGDALYTALAPVATPLVVPPGVVVAGFKFKILASGSVSLLPSLGTFGKTRVISTTPGVEITGTIGGPACVGLPGTWTDLGMGLAGTGGIVPVLTGSGPQDCEALVSFALTDARANEPAYFLYGASYLGLAFKGGIIVPDFLVAQFYVLFVTTPSGTVNFSATWPLGIPPGTSIYYQFWLKDPGGIKGWEASNGLRSTTG